MNGVVDVRVEGGVATVIMEDRAHKNTFSAALVAGLRQAFADIATRADVRAVVLTGYDTYFCCGGTQEELLAMNAGHLRLADMDFFDLPLRCEVPVVAAMQGHGIGGGLAFGLYADVIVMANEALYGANFMKYGFTPGFGATCIIPWKLGEALGAEMLLTAAIYPGWQLRERGVAARVVPRHAVHATARALADELAEKPLLSLKLLKRRLNARLRDECRAAVEAEMAMHQATFGRPEVRERIQRMF